MAGKRVKNTSPYVALSDSELAYIDRSLREGESIESVGRKLGYGTHGVFLEALRRRGFKRGSCLVAISKEKSAEPSVEREYDEVISIFDGKRRATVLMVTRLLRIITLYCEMYVRDEK